MDLQRNTPMKTITSKDTTSIAYDQAGSGPTLILVGGMFEQRAMDSETAHLAALPLLAEHFTVIHYDRRGRGDSTDTLPFAVAREIEDIEALIDAAGGPAYVFGISSGAALAFEAALALGATKVKKLALYEPPYNDEAEGRRAWKAFRRELATTLAEGRRGDAVGLFMSLLGMPADQLAAMRAYPMWPLWEAIAPTIAYDAAALGAEAAVPTERAAGLALPALVMEGGATPYPFMRASAEALAAAMPHGQHRTLDGQSHEVEAAALAPVLIEFFNA
jgi:pimeloyl-ACP methyl ester carboxylesterase